MAMAPLIEKLLNYGAATLCTIVLLLGMVWHFWKLKPAMDVQNQLILNNTMAIQVLGTSSHATAVILDKLSDKLICHDERSLGFQQHIVIFSENIEHIKENMSTMDSTVRMHDRLDKLPDKVDIGLIHDRLGRIEGDVQNITLQVTKVAGKIGC